MAETNSERQAEELEVLLAIYGEDMVEATGFVAAQEDGGMSSPILLTVPLEHEGGQGPSLCAEVVLPPEYPASAAPVVLYVSAPWILPDEVEAITSSLASLAESAMGEVVLHEWVEELKSQVEDLTPVALGRLSPWSVVSLAHPSPSSGSRGVMAFPESEEDKAAAAIDIVSSEPVRSKRSKFVAHVARVRSMAEVDAFKAVLLADSKIAKATHNILAYRFAPAGGPLHEGRDDDGEGGAGDAILQVLQVLGSRDVAVIVTRWYGGVHLGSLRFKIIADISRNLLLECGYVDTSKIKPSDLAGAASAGTGAASSDGDGGGSGGGDGGGAKKRLRPSWEIHSRIKWDPALDEDEFAVGYIDRFTGVEEVAFADFIIEDIVAYEGIPLHRVVYFKRNGELVWDRATRLDLLSHDAPTPTTAAS